MHKALINRTEDWVCDEVFIIGESCTLENREQVEKNMLKKYNTTQFESDLKALEIKLSEKQLEQFLIYYEMLVEWNQVMNLTAIT